MAQAVRFDEYGGIDVLRVVEVPDPVPGAGEVLVRVKAASINPGEWKIRQGLLHSRWPATFPSGEGSDLAGVVAAVGDGVDGFAVGDEVAGFTDRRASHATHVVVEAGNLTRKPAGVSWEAAGSLFVIGTTAYAAVRAVKAGPGDVVAVSGAAGGVGFATVQLAQRAGATVIGIAGPANQDWLREHGVTPVVYGEGLADRLREVGTIDAFIDTHGDGYVRLAVELGVPKDRIDTVADFAAIDEYGVKGEGSAVAATAAVVGEVAGMVDRGEVEIPIAATFPLTEVRAAFEQLEQGHTRGKIVLIP
ncbi:MAG TPA: NADP-dependent oxidoreductase [Pseudonocardiaceae bacterium]|nr:NADP-dependent oxidoreductase [Pseudonocardiaceae bacterium]